MKRPLLLVLPLLLIAAIVAALEQVAASIADDRLPPLLAQRLGMPVSLAPLQLDLIGLSASSDRVQLGSDAQLALRADRVTVSLGWRELLQGNLQLESLRAEALQVSTVNWPPSGPDSADKAPYDYRNLDRWIPRRLQLGKLEVLAVADAPISVSALRGYRHDDSVTLEWEGAEAVYASEAALTLQSLDQLLALEQLDARLALTSENPDLPASRLALAVREQPGKGYQLAVDGDLAGMP
ncbi:MAG: hypothetical protein V2J89_01240, partial [Halieaceae bacterium]|nr:hypothetical protein [Halieaceae bacterium]